MFRAPLSLTGLLLLACLATSPSQSDELKDLYFGEALYYAHQGDFFAALERLDTEVKQHAGLDEPELDSLYFHMNDAEFSLGDFELRYRMHHRAGRAIRAVLEGAVDERVRNDAAYRLARIHFQKGQMEDATRALERIEGKVPESIRDDIEFLRANIYLAQGRPADSVTVLKRLQNSDGYGGFAAYNLGIAYLQEGQQQAAKQQLERAGQIPTSDTAELAIRDKSNLVLGTIFLESGEYDKAIPFLNRVSLDGPFSNQALLSSGWANLSIENLERAVVPWSILAEREVTDRATQEAMLALPYAYGKLNIHGRAAVHYGKALESFSAEVGKLNTSIESIRAGKFLEALIREEIRKDKDWVIRLRSLPETPETYYLMELLASHDFQTGLQNFLDLADLRRKLISWQASFDSFDDMVAIRHNHYEPLLPEVDTHFRELDSRMRLRIEQHKMLVRRRDDLLTTPRPEFLATRGEQAVLKRLEQIETQAQSRDSALGESVKTRIKRLKGLLTWTLETEYHERFTEFDRNLRGLDEAMAVVEAQYDQYVRARQAATHSYVGYEKPISRLRANVRSSIKKVDSLMARQGHELEVVAIEELRARRSHLENYGDKARFALADSYDRATQAQAKIGEKQ
ncbi:MAG: tetratricopeptide repeat protein [Gammaproteobacteria bacterium]|nr:tetratricopeptide repeat protein [Gammaproteobacteria bacterium]MBT8110971.1 tetratricopeptide repeat protein [Gammaproteobacteria bacterium]NND48134.1 tetratricopeptide repeat protein [Woeseiaceae bacterium]NNL45669.1 tetratricopeptide repeat protein [Woeseiaceae bacterium]